jgi:hypothetical protein
MIGENGASHLGIALFEEALVNFENTCDDSKTFVKKDG